MALATLRCQRDAKDHKNTRQRMTIFSGEPFAFDKYQILLRVEQLPYEEIYLFSPAANVIDSLRAMCWRVLMETCDTKLMVRGGSDILLCTMQSRVPCQQSLKKQGMQTCGQFTQETAGGA